MALDAQITLLENLGKMGESLPGLNPTAIIENLAKKADAIKIQLEAVKEEIDELRNRERITKDEAEKMLKEKIKSIIDDFKKKIEQMVNDAISEIQSTWKEIKTQVEQIPKDVSGIIATILIPPAIGAPPVAPNPVYALKLAAQTKSLLVAILNALATNLIRLIKAANMIQFVLPEPVIVVGETIKILDTLLNTIPV